MVLDCGACASSPPVSPPTCPRIRSSPRARRDRSTSPSLVRPATQVARTTHMSAMLSIVIPVRDERESLAPLYREIREVAEAQGYDLEIIFIDDGSSDGSWSAIRQLALDDARVQGIRFRRNFGKAAALSAGFVAAQGDVVMTLDADLQDDPREIPRFVHALAEGVDVVSGWKQVRHDPWHKVLPSRVFNFLVSWLTGVRLHDHNCGMKGYRR